MQIINLFVLLAQLGFHLPRLYLPFLNRYNAATENWSHDEQASKQSSNGKIVNILLCDYVVKSEGDDMME